MNIILRIHEKEVILNELESALTDRAYDKKHYEHWKKIRDKDPGSLHAWYRTGWYAGASVYSESRVDYLKWRFENLRYL